MSATGQRAEPKGVDGYLARLRAVVPPRQAEAVLREVAALIDERIEQEGGREAPGAVDRALAALGPAEALAAAIAGEREAGDFAERTAFRRLVPLVFGVHLLLAVVLTLAGAGTAFVPGIVGALPTDAPLSTGLGVLGIFLTDVGLVAVVVGLLGRDRVPTLLAQLRLELPGTRRDAALSLVLIVLVALLVNVPSFRDALFALGTGDARAPLLAPDLLALVPVLDAALLLLAVRNVLLLRAGGERPASVAVDALASLVLAGLCVLVMTRDELVRVPVGAGLSAEGARALADLLLRVAFVASLIAAVLLMSRAVRRGLRLRDLLRG